ncbi:MAG: sigma-54 dependent transcriptional regulator [Syntrophotaleaceae bacterium]
MNPMQYPEEPVLLVDDEPAWLRSLSFTLKKEAGIRNVIRCDDSLKVKELLSTLKFSLVLIDLNMPGLSGEELLGMIVRDHPEVPVIVVSGVNQVETAVRCMRHGARDYFIKSEEIERLIASIHRNLEFRSLQQENTRLKERVLQDRLENPGAFESIITGSRKMRAVFKYMEAVAPSPEPLLITGESGVGKELIARAMHDLRGGNGPWVAVNVAGLDDNIFSDTLFGHAKGAFTGADQVRSGMIAQAAVGTLFLDEIGDLSSVSQIKLLRLLQEKEFFPLGSDRPLKLQARIVVGTNVDLLEKLDAGAFRKDLYFRLCAHHIHVPPLRERPEDLPLLLHHFIREAARALGKKRPTPPRELPNLLSTYSFPGNIRELRAMVFDAVSLNDSGILSMEPFKKALLSAHGGSTPRSGDHRMLEKKIVRFSEQLPTMGECIDSLIEEAMKRAQGNQTLAAGMLGISRQALGKRLKKQFD